MGCLESVGSFKISKGDVFMGVFYTSALSRLRQWNRFFEYQYQHHVRECQIKRHSILYDDTHTS
jgi:hypothetical protein